MRAALDLKQETEFSDIARGGSVGLAYSVASTASAGTGDLLSKR